MGGYISNVFRFLFSWIDGIVIWAIEKVYNLLISLTNLTVFSDKIINTLGKRISIIIGVVFLFRAAFAIVQYIVNPEKLTDGKNGSGKIVFNVVVSLTLLVSYNFIFKQAYILQGKILGVQTSEDCNCDENDSTCGTPQYSGVLERIVFGVGNVNTSSNIKSAGSLMSYAMYTAFVYPNPDVVGDQCENVYTGGTDDSARTNLATCIQALNAAGVNAKTSREFTKAIQKKSAYELIDYELLTDMSKSRDENGKNTGSTTNTFTYYPIVSTICAGIVVIMLVNFCIDVAIRMVKLGFLQLIAPIPILSNIIPGQEKMLSKWASECGKAYIDIFIKLLALYFAIFVIMAVLNTGIYDVTTGCKVGFWSNPIGVILIILGALIFAQQLPKLISNITGINLEGSFSLNPMKKIGQSSLASAAVGFVGGGVAGLASNAFAFAQNKKNLSKKPVSELTEDEKYSMSRERLFHSLSGGFFGGQFRGLSAGLKGGGKGSALDSIRKGLSASNQARTDREAIRQFNANARETNQDEYGFMQRHFYDPLSRAAGYKNKDAGVGQMDKQIKIITRKMANLDMDEEGARREKERFFGKDTTTFSEAQFKEMIAYESKYDALNDRRNAGEQLNQEEQQIVDYVDSKRADTVFMDQKKEYEKLQGRIDYLDDEYEKLRQEKGRLEDAQRRFAESQNKNK